jgi:hypothetical protein
MGNQHNTYVYNSTKEVVRVILTDTNNRRSDQVLQVGETFCFPTPHGRNTVSLLRKLPNSTDFDTKSCADYTDDSDYSFIIKEKEGRFVFVRAKYGTVTEEAPGAR